MALREIGADAPDFELMNDVGESFRLSDLRGHLRAMLVFYPKDFTPGCTDQLIHIRRNIRHLRMADIEPIGVNSGDAASHLGFRKAHALNFDLLVDIDDLVARDYGAWKADDSGIQRSVVVVGKDGRVVFAEHGAPPWQRVLTEVRRIENELATRS